jgi:hypothetical protein
LAVAIALKPDVPKNKSGKVLNRVQHGLNLQLNSWSPGRVLALFKQLANYSKCGRPAILFYRLGGPRAVYGRGGERRRRPSELQFASPPVATRNGLARPAHRRARDNRKKVLCCQDDGMEHNENSRKQPTNCATDPKKHTSMVTYVTNIVLLAISRGDALSKALSCEKQPD